MTFGNHLLVTPTAADEQMKPGIGHNMYCTVDDAVQHQDPTVFQRDVVHNIEIFILKTKVWSLATIPLYHVQH